MSAQDITPEGRVDVGPEEWRRRQSHGHAGPCTDECWKGYEALFVDCMKEAERMLFDQYRGSPPGLPRMSISIDRLVHLAIVLLDAELRKAERATMSRDEE